MATKPLSKPTRRSSDVGKEDLHVRISDRPNAPETAPGEGGRYVYGIVETKEHLNFGKIGIGGAGEAVYGVNYQDIAAVVSRWTGVPVSKLLEGEMQKLLRLEDELADRQLHFPGTDGRG